MTDETRSSFQPARQVEQPRSIEVENLHKAFGDEQVLEEISFRVDPNEFCVIVGPSGCGKSTLLNCIAGVEAPTTGTVAYDGTDASTIPVAERNIGFVFQEFEDTLFPHRTVGENVTFGLEQQDRDFSDDELEWFVDTVLRFLAIDELRDDYPKNLSGGQQQRVELARQLVRGCDVMLFDDPLADLDYKLQKRLEVELRGLHAKHGGTYLYVTHNQDQALKLADKVIVMNAGRIEQIGSPTVVYEQPETAFVARFIGDSNLFEGRLSTREETLVVETGAGPLRSHDDCDAEPGADVLGFVRPESVRTGEAARECVNTTGATIAGRTYMGEQTEFTVDVEGMDEEFLVRIPGNVTLGPEGTDITVGWNPEDMLLYTQDSISTSEDLSFADLKEL